MSADVLNFDRPAEDVEIPLVDEPEVALEPEPEIELEPAAPLALVSTGLVEILPADFKLSPLVKFIPNPQLRIAADQAATYVESIAVEGPEGLSRVDVALTALRSSLAAITEHFEEPATIANFLHKHITGTRAEWQARGKQTIEIVGRKVYTEQKRLEALEAEERRKKQAEADRQAKETARQEAEAAAKAQAPAQVVEELKRQAETATAPPVQSSTPAPTMRGTSTVAKWKARLIGTPGSDEPNPKMSNLTNAQRAEVLKLLKAVLEGAAPMVLFELNWSVLNARAAAEKSTLALPGVEAFDEGGVRAKGQRSR
jgi:hypothetical protein